MNITFETSDPNEVLRLLLVKEGSEVLTDVRATVGGDWLTVTGKMTKNGVTGNFKSCLATSALLDLCLTKLGCEHEI